MATTADTLAVAFQHHQQGNFSHAEHLYRRILVAEPNHAVALHFLGALTHQTGRHTQAAAYLRRAVELQPGDAAIHSNLGLVYKALGRLDEAVASYRQALKLRPVFPEAFNNLGIALADQRKFEDAVVHYREALRLRPDYGDAHYNLGMVLADGGRLDEAVACQREALRWRPTDPDVHLALGVALANQGRYQEAIATYHEALRLRPGDPEVHFNLAQQWLLEGHFDKGWPAYEWRWQTRRFARRAFSQPRWDGSDLASRTILLHAEQGLGDTLQFLRYVPLVNQRGGRVVVECPPGLLSLARTMPAIDHLVAAGSPLPPFDVQAGLLSLPGIFGTSLETVPADVPYLEVAPRLVERWQHEMTGLPPGFRVGIVWQGNPLHRGDWKRSVAIRQFEPVARLAGVCMISMQVGAGVEQLDTVAGDWPITDLGRRFDASSFDDAAAALHNLDLLVTVDTAIAHLAGALAVPVWVLLPFTPDWRWLLNRDDSPWYPTMRLFRQKRLGDWREVFERLEAELQRRVPEHYQKYLASHGQQSSEDGPSLTD
jgi:Flp pilus assembly protein TadD